MNNYKNTLLNIIKNIYIHQRFFIYISVISALFLVSFWFPILYSLAWFLVTILAVFFFADIYMLFNLKKGVTARRILTEKFSNSDENPVPITVKSNYKFTIEVKIIDEVPVQFQKRDFEHIATLKPLGDYNFEYEVKPVEKGDVQYV